MTNEGLKKKLLSIFDGMKINLSKEINDLFQSLSERIIETFTNGVAKEIEIYLESHPNRGIDQLLNEDDFSSIVLQKFGETGYTALAEQGTGKALLHPDSNLTGRSMLVGEEHSPLFKRMYEAATNGKPAKGYYEKLLPNGETQKKFLCLIPFMNYFAGTTITLEEFLSPTKTISSLLDERTEEFSKRITDQILNPIEKLSKEASIIASGSFEHPLKIESGDEIGELANAFNNMKLKIGERNEELVKEQHELDAMIKKLEEGRGELTEAKDRLEIEVKERTADLEKAKNHIEEQTNALNSAANELKRKIEQMQILSELIPQLISTDEEKKILQMVVDVSNKLVGARRAAIALFEEGTYKARISTMFKDPSIKEECTAKKMPTGKAVYRDVYFGKKKSMRVEDLKSHPHSTKLPKGHIPVKGSLVAVRLEGTKGQSIGIFVVNDKIGEGKFTQSDEDILIYLADIASITYEKIRLLKELENLNLSLEEKMRERTKELEESQKQLIHTEKVSATGRLVSSIAHDLANPLSSIIGYSDLLYNEKKLENIKEDIPKIVKDIQRCDKMIQNLLSFSTGHEPKKEKISVNQELTNVLEYLDFELRKTNVKIMKNLDKSVPKIIADKFQLQQVFINILLNAIETVRRKRKEGVVSVETAADDDRIIIKFKDNGQGIPEENFEKIFDPFFTTKEDGKGTGLGLYISKGIIEEHDGEIQVESAPQEGTTFTIKLHSACP